MKKLLLIALTCLCIACGDVFMDNKTQNKDVTLESKNQYQDLTLDGIPDQMSYYYRGEKINITVDRGCVNVIADEDFMQSSVANKTLQKFNLERDERNPIQGMTKLKFITTPDVMEFKNAIAALKQNEQIKYVFPFFENAGAEPVGTSDVFYLRMKDENDTLLLKNEAEQLKVQIVKQIPYMPEWYILSIKNSDFHNTIEASNYFYETGLFEDVDPAFMLDFKPACLNDPLYSMWGLVNLIGFPGMDINICNAWSITKGEGVKIALVDFGIDRTNPQLSPSLDANKYDAKSGTSNTSLSYNMYESHGTHLAGTMVAKKDLVQPYVGVAPDAKLIEVSHDFTGSMMSAELASGISWATNYADIINCAWDFPPGSPFFSYALELAISNALGVNGRGGKGCVVVCSAGNTSGVIGYPASCNNDILVVGSIDSMGFRAFDSGYGPQLDVVAPGVHIWSLKNSGDYHDAFKSGTSMAAAHVSGIAALILSVKPNLTSLQVRNLIETTAKKAHSVPKYNYIFDNIHTNGMWNNEMGYGLVDAYNVVK